jgi:molybdopterin-guanine dinucleotide biosynthesis protein A
MDIHDTQMENGFSIVIQAGGRSSRMGEDKALMPFLGRPLITRLIERLTGQGDELLLTTNAPADYAFLNLPLFSDLMPGLGALGGLYTALAAARYPYVAVVACDMPFLAPRLLRAQYDLLVKEEMDIVIPRTAEGLEPLHAVYRRATCLPAVRAALEAGERKMSGWLAAVRVREMDEQKIKLYDPGLLSFVNANTPEELRKAEAIARSLPNL